MLVPVALNSTPSGPADSQHGSVPPVARSLDVWWGPLNAFGVLAFVCFAAPVFEQSIPAATPDSSRRPDIWKFGQTFFLLRCLNTVTICPHATAKLSHGIVVGMSISAFLCLRFAVLQLVVCHAPAHFLSMVGSCLVAVCSVVAYPDWYGKAPFRNKVSA